MNLVRAFRYYLKAALYVIIARKTDKQFLALKMLQKYCGTKEKVIYYKEMILGLYLQL